MKYNYATDRLSRLAITLMIVGTGSLILLGDIIPGWPWYCKTLIALPTLVGVGLTGYIFYKDELE